MNITEAASARSGVWEPISTAPKDGTIIDIWLAGARWTDCYYGTDTEPTHWMPAPLPPNDPTETQP